jgi:hypothetical protein
MTRIVKKILVGILALGLFSGVAYADSGKGQKLYSKKLKKACGINGAKFAQKHTVEEWEKTGVKGMKNEIKKICPKVKSKSLKSKYLQHYYDFVIDYASDSGNVPSC